MDAKGARRSGDCAAYGKEDARRMRPLKEIRDAIGAAAAAAVLLPGVAGAAPLDVTVVAGNGTEGHGGDGGPATHAQLANPARLGLRDDGSLLIADLGLDAEDDQGRVRGVTPGGGMTTLFTPAPAEVFRPVGVTGIDGAVPAHEGYAVVDDWIGAVYFNGERIAGGTEDSHEPGEPDADPTEGEGGACDADLRPMDIDYDGMVAVLPLDVRPAFLVAHQAAEGVGDAGEVHRLRPAQVTQGCSLWGWHRVAGGAPGPEGASIAPSGHGLPATSAYLNDVRAVAALPGGGFLIATAGGAPQDCRVRRVSPAGVVQTVAGTGQCAYGGDGGQATQTPLSFPIDVAPTPDGGFLIVEALSSPDELGVSIRRVAPDGTTTRLQTTIPLGGIRGVIATPEGDVLVSAARRVFRVDADFAPPPSQPPPPPPRPQPPPPRAAPQPPAPRAAPAKPALTLRRSAYRVVRGKTLALRFTASAAGRFELRAMKESKRVLRSRGAVRAGANTIRVRAKLTPGRYALVLKLTTTAGTASDRARLTVRRPR
jgi:hypothetical protein